MKTVKIVYYSGKGATKSMAEYVAEGVKAGGGDPELIPVVNADPEDVAGCDVFALGCPASGIEVLNEDRFEPFMKAIEEKISGKKIALFGSYGWGDGKWMRDWEDRLRTKGAIIAGDKGVIMNLPLGKKPDGEIIGKLKELGKLLMS